MFGYVLPDFPRLSRAERARWQGVYCGLCHRLHDGYGRLGRATLTYDMTFLALLHLSIYGGAPGASESEAQAASESQAQAASESENEAQAEGESEAQAASESENEALRTCIRHPLKKRPAVEAEAIDYAADMNIALAYYKCLDDWQDDGDRLARSRADRLGAHMPAIRGRWPRQCAAIEEGIAALSRMEQAGELNPDLPVNCFGRLLAEVFVRQEDAHAPGLRRMGAAMGRYVYLLDAVNDLRQDIRRQRYNPLTGATDTDYIPALSLMMAEATQAFESLPAGADLGILRNILYAGVWLGLRRSAVPPQYRRPAQATHENEEETL